MTKTQKTLSYSLAIAVSVAMALFIFAYGWQRTVGSGPPQPGSDAYFVVDHPETLSPEQIPSRPDDLAGDAVRWYGYTPDQTAFIAASDEPTLSEVAPHLMAAGPDEIPQADEPVYLYRYLYKAHEDTIGGEWVDPRQGIGDCVSFGWANGIDIILAIDFVNGDSGDWLPVATESLYGGSRVEGRGMPGDGAREYGGRSDGSTGTWAKSYVENFGVTFRKDYPEAGHNLSKYDARRAKEWGAFGNGGRNDNGKFDEIARQHPVKDCALVRTYAEAKAALKNGYPVVVCSGQGFASQRDRSGMAQPRGTWYHCMNFVGYRPAQDGLPEAILCQNSWGPDWISGPRVPEDQPRGSFWVDPATANRMFAGRDSFAVSTVKGFPRRKLDWHEGW